jgi:hypothetical protein
MPSEHFSDGDVLRGEGVDLPGVHAEGPDRLHLDRHRQRKHAQRSVPTGARRVRRQSRFAAHVAHAEQDPGSSGVDAWPLVLDVLHLVGLLGPLAARRHDSRTRRREHRQRCAVSRSYRPCLDPTDLLKDIFQVSWASATPASAAAHPASLHGIHKGQLPMPRWPYSCHRAAEAGARIDPDANDPRVGTSGPRTWSTRLGPNQPAPRPSDDPVIVEQSRAGIARPRFAGCPSETSNGSHHQRCRNDCGPGSPPEATALQEEGGNGRRTRQRAPNRARARESGGPVRLSSERADQRRRSPRLVRLGEPGRSRTGACHRAARVRTARGRPRIRLARHG